MTIKNANAKADQGAIVLANVMKATGLSETQARELLLMDDDKLDQLCEDALSNIDDTRTVRTSKT